VIGQLLITTNRYISINIGDIYQTSTEKLVKIVGATREKFDTILLESKPTLRVSPNQLPAPKYGVKGSFYFLFGGEVCFASYL
jgi:hypothetical protein